VAGKKYLDFFGGIVTVGLGHCEPRVVAAIEKQVRTLQHVSTLFPTEPLVALAERVCELFPGERPAKAFFTNSGTEAIETAILTARLHTQRTEVIALRHGYHGRSMLAMSMTGHAPWRLGGMHDPAIRHAVAPYCYRCPLKLSYPSCGVACATDVEDVIKTTTSGRPAAFIAEPIMGVGGFITPPKEYPGIVAEIVRRHEGLYIADEVQTGWGRTGGKWFGIEQYGVKPDIVVGAKSLGNGVPIGLTMARAAVADSWKGSTIATFGGNPVTAAAAKAVIDVIESDGLVENAATTGGHFRRRLEGLQEKHAAIGEVRGMGFMQGLELVKDRQTKEPAPERATAVLEAAKDRGLIIGKGGLLGNVLRISPALNVTPADADQAAELLDQAFVATAI
jgi:4-aminobutyrate aminotransferase